MGHGAYFRVQISGLVVSGLPGVWVYELHFMV